MTVFLLTTLASDIKPRNVVTNALTLDHIQGLVLRGFWFTEVFFLVTDIKLGTLGYFQF